MGRKKGIDKPCSSNAVEFGSPIESNISELTDKFDGYDFRGHTRGTLVVGIAYSLQSLCRCASP